MHAPFVQIKHLPAHVSYNTGTKFRFLRPTNEWIWPWRQQNYE